jgi:hypothetical protein
VKIIHAESRKTVSVFYTRIHTKLYFIPPLVNEETQEDEKMLKKWSSLLTALALSVAMFAVLSTSVNALPVVVINGNYKIEFCSMNYDSDTNLQTWTYNITCLAGHGISHIVFEFKTVCDPPISAIKEGAWGPSSIVIEVKDYEHPDSTTGVSGIKFESSLEPGNWMLVWFTLEGQWPVGTIEVWTKAANDNAAPGESVMSGIVDGPECMPNNNIPEVPFGSILAGASMLVALVAYSVVRRRNSKQKVQ